MTFAWILNALGLGVGAALGARALFDPLWAARRLGVAPNAEDGGFAAFRAGGAALLAAHMAALAMSLMFLLGGEYVIGVAATGAAAVLGAAWAGAFGGGVLSLLLDRSDAKFNAAVEAALALAIAAPWLVWVFAHA